MDATTFYGLYADPAYYPHWSLSGCWLYMTICCISVQQWGLNHFNITACHYRMALGINPVEAHFVSPKSNWVMSKFTPTHQ